MKVKINNKQYKALLNASKAIAELYEEGMAKFNDVLKLTLRDYSEDVDFSEIELNFVTNSAIKENYEKIKSNNWNEIDVPVLERTLDLFIRTGLGQWNELSYLTDEWNLKDDVISELSGLRNLIPSYERIPGDVRGSSLGIGSEKLKEDVTIIYDFYKVLMFEDGHGGVYGHQPYAISSELLPEIYFDETLVTVENIDRMVLDSVKNKKAIIIDEDGYWLPLSECSHRLFTPDTHNFYKKKNNYFRYEKK